MCQGQRSLRQDDVVVVNYVNTKLRDLSSNGTEVSCQVSMLVSDLCPLMLMMGGGARHYNLCLASTCLHFGGFIDSSLTVVACALVVNGVTLLCQLRQE